MKKFFLLAAGFIALLLLIANLGPIVLLAVSLGILYVIFKKFLKTGSVMKKIGWLILGLLVVSVTISNIHAVIGIAAGYVLYIIYKEWKRMKSERLNKKLIRETDDPFMNFEKQWAELTK